MWSQHTYLRFLLAEQPRTCFQSSGHLIKPQRIWMRVVFSLHWSRCVGEEEQHNNWARNTDEVPVCSAFWKHAYSLCFVLLFFFPCWCCTLLSCHMWCRPWSPHSPRLTAPLHTRTSGAHLEHKHLSSSLLERGTGDQGDMRTEYKVFFCYCHKPTTLIFNAYLLGVLSTQTRTSHLTDEHCSRFKVMSFFSQ